MPRERGRQEGWPGRREGGRAGCPGSGAGPAPHSLRTKPRAPRPPQEGRVPPPAPQGDGPSKGLLPAGRERPRSAARARDASPGGRAAVASLPRCRPKGLAGFPGTADLNVPLSSRSSGGASARCLLWDMASREGRAVRRGEASSLPGWAGSETSAAAAAAATASPDCPARVPRAKGAGPLAATPPARQSPQRFPAPKGRFPGLLGRLGEQARLLFRLLPAPLPAGGSAAYGSRGYRRRTPQRREGLFGLWLRSEGMGRLKEDFTVPM